MRMLNLGGPFGLRQVYLRALSGKPHESSSRADDVVGGCLFSFVWFLACSMRPSGHTLVSVTLGVGRSSRGYRLCGAWLRYATAILAC